MSSLFWDHLVIYTPYKNIQSAPNRSYILCNVLSSITHLVHVLCLPHYIQ